MTRPSGEAVARLGAQSSVATVRDKASPAASPMRRTVRSRDATSRSPSLPNSTDSTESSKPSRTRTHSPDPFHRRTV
jgi:hypothetical protein